MNNSKKIMGGNIHQKLAGIFRVKVVDNTGKVTWESEPMNNLILNQGMDMLANWYYYQVFLYCVSGTGTRGNVITSSSECSQSGYEVALTSIGSLTSFTQSLGGYANALEAGDVIQFADGTEAQVVLVTDQSASVKTTATVSTQSFMIWKTSQVGLQSEVKKTSTALVGGANCGTSQSYNNMQLYKTFDFAAQTASVYYTELGMSTSGGSPTPTTVFCRKLLDAPLLVPSASQLRVTYNLLISVAPSASTARTNIPIGNWPVAPSTNTNGNDAIQVVKLCPLDSNGDGPGSPAGALEPNASGDRCAIFISRTDTPLTQPLLTSSNPLPPDRVSPVTTDYSFTGKSYTNGNYYIDKTAVFSVAQGNYTDLKCMGFGRANSQPAYGSNVAYTFVFEQTQSKNNLQTLTLTFRTSWARTLQN